MKASSKHIKRTVHIAGPCIFENLMVTLVAFINTFMVASLGPAATAAVSLNTGPNWVLNGLTVLFSVSGTVLVAQNIGAGKPKEANTIASQVMGMAVIFSFFVMLIFFAVSGVFPAWMNAEPDVAELATVYLRIYSISVMVHFLGLVASGLLRGSGNTFSPMLVSFLMNVIVVVANLFLIYPTRTVSLFGLSFSMFGAGLGVTGAAISTALAQTVAGLTMVALLFRKKQSVRIQFKELFKMDKTILKKVLDIGLPSTGERLSVNFGLIAYQRIIMELGTIAVAAHHLATTVEALCYQPSFGFSIAATTLVGQSLGAKNKDEAQVYGRLSLYMCFAMGCFAAFVFFVFPNQLLGLFSDVPEVINNGRTALRIIAVVEPFYALSVVFTGVLRGAGDTKIPFLASLIGMWGVRQVTAWFFAIHMGFGLGGAWVGMGVDIMVRVSLLYARYRRKKWLDITLEDAVSA